jgi:hypothetical protein
MENATQNSQRKTLTLPASLRYQNLTNDGEFLFTSEWFHWVKATVVRANNCAVCGNPKGVHGGKHGFAP